MIYGSLADTGVLTPVKDFFNKQNRVTMNNRWVWIFVI